MNCIIYFGICGSRFRKFARASTKEGKIIREVSHARVGAPFGEPGAYWVLLGPDVELRRTAYDFVNTAEQFRNIKYPQAQDDAQNLLHPPSEQEMLELYSTAEPRP